MYIYIYVSIYLYVYINVVVASSPSTPSTAVQSTAPSLPVLAMDFAPEGTSPGPVSAGVQLNLALEASRNGPETTVGRLGTIVDINIYIYIYI